MTTTTACVLYAGHLDHKGYGKVWAGGRVAYAHRAAWEAVHGPIPPGLEVHHVCETKACMNVAHLMAVTRTQHVALHAPTHCVNGHPFDAENTYVSPNGRRHCRPCNRAWQARYKAARKAVAA